MAKSIDIHGTVVNGVAAPRLTELKERKCSIEELQAALVQLIEITNLNQAAVCELADRVDQKQDRPWRATL